MRIPDDPVFQQIINYTVSPDTNDLTFLNRLAMENRWQPAFAYLCFQEYKKFIYLMTISPKPLTPSDQVDQVWHLHLTYSESYWLNFCGEIIDKELHHQPTLGGEKESIKFYKQYQFTLAFYQRTFKVSPAADIWPTPEKRFQRLDSFIRVNKREAWVIPKPTKLISNFIQPSNDKQRGKDGGIPFFGGCDSGGGDGGDGGGTGGGGCSG